MLWTTYTPLQEGRAMDIRDVLVELRLQRSEVRTWKTDSRAKDLQNFWDGELRGLTTAIELLEKLDVRE